MTLLALLMCAAPAFAQTSGTWDTKLGGGATGLLNGALTYMRNDGKPDACLSGMKAHVNLFTPADPKDPRTRAGAFSRFHFYFFSPASPPRIALSINLPIEGGPYPAQARYNEYEAYYSPPASLHGIRETCISELAVDTGKALAVAAKHGLPLGTMSAYELFLIYAANPREPDWTDRALRKKIFWTVSIAPEHDDKTVRQYLVDALDGSFLKARTVKIKR